jgi:hypothetical protein
MTKKDKKVKMSVPEGIEFGTPYNMNTTLHNKHYWDTDRNIDHNSNINPKMLLSKEELYKNEFKNELLKVTKEITELLILKNKAYGNTALNPTNIFSKLNATEAICARIDDKLARINNKGINDLTEDTVDDLIGYLLLLKMSI